MTKSKCEHPQTAGGVCVNCGAKIAVDGNIARKKY
jgi:hypothetical protein